MPAHAGAFRLSENIGEILIRLVIIFHRSRPNDSDYGLIVATGEEGVADVYTVFFFPCNSRDKLRNVVALVLAAFDDIEIGGAADVDVDIVFVAQFRDVFAHVRDQFFALSVVGIEYVFDILIFVVADKTERDLASAIFDYIFLVAYGVGKVFARFFNKNMDRLDLGLGELSFPQNSTVGFLSEVAVLCKNIIASVKACFQVVSYIFLRVARNDNDIGALRKTFQYGGVLERNVRLASRESVVEIEEKVLWHVT